MEDKCPPFFLMAQKHSVILRSKAEVALACGTPTRMVAASLGVSRSTIAIWMKPWRALAQKNAIERWRQANPEAISRHNKTYRSRYPEKVKQRNRLTYLKHYKNNPEYYAEKASTRRRNLKKILLTLEERKKIQALLREARRLSIETGIPHEVDHIWPISKGGLHHPSNMRVITREENRSKGSRIPEITGKYRNNKNEEIP